MIADATAKGARIVVGGGRDGRLVQPTLLDGLTRRCGSSTRRSSARSSPSPRSTRWRRRSSSPNDSPYGLSAGVFTDSLQRAWQAVRGLQTGNVHVNEISSWRADHMPYGGVKDSGFGKEGPAYAMAEMTHFKTVSFRV